MQSQIRVVVLYTKVSIVHTRLLTKLRKITIFCDFFLHICNFCCTFAPILSRDGGIGRHEGLKILWPVMAVRVQVPLAVQKEMF